MNEKPKEEVELRRLLHQMYQETAPDIFNSNHAKLAYFLLALQRKYPVEHEKCILWHVGAGSSYPQYVDTIDFAGDDSVLQFVKDLLK